MGSLSAGDDSVARKSCSLSCCHFQNTLFFHVVLTTHPATHSTCPIIDEYTQYTIGTRFDGGSVHGYTMFRRFMPLERSWSDEGIMKSTEAWTIRNLRNHKGGRNGPNVYSRTSPKREINVDTHTSSWRAKNEETINAVTHAKARKP